MSGSSPKEKSRFRGSSVFFRIFAGMAKKGNKKKSLAWTFRLNIILILAVLIVGFVLINIFLKAETRHNKTFMLPDLSGLTVREAHELASELDIDIRLEVTDSIYIRGAKSGMITRQNPAPGSNVKKGRRVLLVINSINPKKVRVPQLEGLSLRQARTELSSYGLKVGKLIYVDDIATNNVLDQHYKGESIEPGTMLEIDTPVDLVLGRSENAVTYIPNVIGYKYPVAREIINDHSLNIDRLVLDFVAQTYSDSLNALIYSQYPPASDSVSLRLGSNVTLYLTNDPSKIIIPDEQKSISEDEE